MYVCLGVMSCRGVNSFRSSGVKDPEDGSSDLRKHKKYEGYPESKDTKNFFKIFNNKIEWKNFQHIPLAIFNIINTSVKAFV
jgi:hypothetical protein